MSRRGCSLPANASGVDPHRASITSRFGQVELELDPPHLTLVEAVCAAEVQLGLPQPTGLSLKGRLRAVAAQVGVGWGLSAAA
jgi:hypothetical protein